MDHPNAPEIEVVSLGEVGSIGKYLITKSQWDAVCQLPRENINLEPTYCLGRTANHPVNNVSWLETQEFCERLYRKTLIRYRLPTSEEWDLAAIRNPRPRQDFSNINIQPVNNHIPNEIGVYGMFGSYWQWLTPDLSSGSVTRPAKGGTYGNIRDMEDVVHVSPGYHAAVLGFRVFVESHYLNNPIETLTWLKK